jgi:hypothetical protein
LLTLCLISSVAAQNETPITIEPARVLSHYGDSETVNLSLPIQAGVGVVATTDIKRSEASALRLHFVVSAPSAGPTWGVQVLDKNKKRVWSYSAVEDPSADFWSNEIPGELATVQVLAVAEISSLRLSIDRIIVSRKPTEGRGLTVNKLKSIDKAPPNIQGWGRSVARLVFVRDGSGQFLCTGFLVAPDLFLTNNHCIKTPTEMSSGLAEFDYDKAGAIPMTLHFKKIVKTNPELDFTLLRLATPSDRQPFTFDTSVIENQLMVIIQHPAGRPKQVSIDNCKVFGAQVAGVTPALTDFGHGCDTLGGSSGSPVLDIQTGRVLGLHHLGYLPNNEPINRAVRIQQIIQYLNTELKDDPAARQALGLPPLP